MLANLVSHDCCPEFSLRLSGSMAHAEWCHVRLSACQVSVCQLSQVLQGARVIICGHWKPLATSRAGPAHSRCSLGAGVLRQILCKSNLKYCLRLAPGIRHSEYLTSEGFEDTHNKCWLI